MRTAFCPYTMKPNGLWSITLIGVRYLYSEDKSAAPPGEYAGLAG